jgi:hypothetical protein
MLAVRNVQQGKPDALLEGGTGAQVQGQVKPTALARKVFAQLLASVLEQGVIILMGPQGAIELARSVFLAVKPQTGQSFRTGQQAHRPQGRGALALDR